MENISVLLIEDDKDIRETVRILLEGEGFKVDEADNGADGLKKVTDETNLIILDVMLPGISGFKTCEEIRKFSYVPILFLTAKSKESDKLLGFMAGGDDYLVKPFSYPELFARVKALLRRHHVYDGKSKKSDAGKQYIHRNGLKINTNKNQVFIDEAEVELTEIEYQILCLMAKHPEEIFSVQKIYESIWQEPFYTSSANTVMVHIRNIRNKIEKTPQKPAIILTVWGKGYRLV